MDDKKVKKSNDKEELKDQAVPLTAIAGDEELSSEVNHFLSDIFNKNTTAYDSAIDAHYLSGQAGSSATHHIVDGSHTFWGAFEEAQRAYPHDSALDAATAAFEHLMRDFTTNSGINPAVSIGPEQLEGLKDSLTAVPGISRSWINDFLTVNAFEAVGSVLVLVGALYGLKKQDYSYLGKVIGGSSFASLVSANALLAVVAVIIAVVAWKGSGPESKVLLKRGIIRGGTLTAVATGISALVDGPVILGLSLGIYTAYVVNQKLDGRELKDPISVNLKRFAEKTLHISSGVCIRAGRGIWKTIKAVRS